MTKPDRLRVEWAYEPDTPLCCNCVGYRKARMAHDDRGAVVLQPAKCGKGGFPVHPLGCCNKWSSKRGERLTP